MLHDIQTPMRRLTLLLGTLALTACASTLDIDRARRWLDTPPEPELPSFQEGARAALPAPRGLRATSGELRAVALHWEPLLGGDVGGYMIERAKEREGPFEQIAAVPGRATTVYLDTGAKALPSADGSKQRAELSDGETAFYRLRAFTPAGELAEAASEIAPATTAPPPEPPQRLRAYSHQPREVPLSWEASTDALVAGYVVERSPTSRGPFEPLAQIEGRHRNVYLDRGLGDLRVFYYRVSSVNRAGGLGEPSKPVLAVTKAEPLPPIGLRVLAQRLGENELAWEPNVESDVAGYRLLRIRGDGETAELVTSVAGDRTVAADTQVAADERVSYTVVVHDRDGLESAAAKPIVVESEGYSLAATLRPDGIHLEWNPRTGEGYHGARIFLQRVLDQRELAFVEGSRYVHTDVKPGERYRYTAVLERPDASQAPTSSPVEIEVP
jgi:fibronectin type 3 domain-containing protein